MNITPAGKALPCHAAETLPGLDFPSVREQSLAAIWRSAPVFERFRGTAWMAEPCRSCDRREIDWGGCRCQALALTGDAANTDPACALSPHHGAMLAAIAEAAGEAEAGFVYRRIGAAAKAEAKAEGMSRRGPVLALAAIWLLAGGIAGAAPQVFPVTEVAPGIFVRHGVDQDATAENDDAIANIGFIVGTAAVAVIDPGGSRGDGERLRATVRAETDRPIRYVVMTHDHPDHVFGGSAFLPDHPVFVGHARLPGALAERGDYYRRRLAEILGADRVGDYVVRRNWSRIGPSSIWAAACSISRPMAPPIPTMT